MSLPPHDKQRRSDMLAMRRKDGCLIRQMFRGRDIGCYLQKYEITLKYGLFVGGFFNLIFLSRFLVVWEGERMVMSR